MVGGCGCYGDLIQQADPRASSQERHLYVCVLEFWKKAAQSTGQAWLSTVWKVVDETRPVLAPWFVQMQQAGVKGWHEETLQGRDAQIPAFL